MRILIAIVFASVTQLARTKRWAKEQQSLRTGVLFGQVTGEKKRGTSAADPAFKFAMTQVTGELRPKTSSLAQRPLRHLTSVATWRRE